MEIELDILWLDDEQQNQQSGGLTIPIEDCITKKHTFYNISFIRPSEEQGYSYIASNGELYTVRIEYNDLRNLIKNNINFQLN